MEGVRPMETILAALITGAADILRLLRLGECISPFSKRKEVNNKKYIFDPKSGVIEEATPETYVEDTYLTKK